MSDIIIRAESLSKLYKIGALKQRHDTLRDQLDRLGIVHEGVAFTLSHEMGPIRPSIPV